MPVRARITGQDGEETLLPPGQRDASGFWFPAGYSDPKMLVRRRSRRLQGVRMDPRRRRSKVKAI